VGEYLAFMRDGGYKRPELWLSEGWAHVQQAQWSQPLYWIERDGQWHQFTLSGLHPLNHNEPVCHVSYFEADAFARWFGARLPTEAEWEIAAASEPIEGNFVESERFHPAAAEGQNGDMRQLYGDVWEWTQSAYSSYPGYQPVPGPLGEYNGKFMCGQFVLRGGSCATSITHIRPTYRNFFPPTAQWQFSGIRLARDI
jgi:ergothioneine biosynthesis protein EgtB